MIDLVVGSRIHRLVILRVAGDPKGKAIVTCRCDCGAEKPFLAKRLATNPPKTGCCKTCPLVQEQARKQRVAAGRKGGRQSALNRFGYACPADRDIARAANEAEALLKKRGERDAAKEQRAEMRAAHQRQLKADALAQLPSRLKDPQYGLILKSLDDSADPIASLVCRVCGYGFKSRALVIALNATRSCGCVAACQSRKWQHNWWYLAKFEFKNLQKQCKEKGLQYEAFYDRITKVTDPQARYIFHYANDLRQKLWDHLRLRGVAPPANYLAVWNDVGGQQVLAELGYGRQEQKEICQHLRSMNQTFADIPFGADRDILAMMGFLPVSPLFSEIGHVPT